LTERIPISDAMAADVLFASDRTCCVCRLERHKVQIHHVDEDPANNSFENLAVICLHCHSDAHTTGAFVRNLTPELIRLYNTSWRDIVRLRLVPGAHAAPQRELAAEAFLEASLDCHYWKVFFMSIAGQPLPDGRPGQFIDVWDLMVELWIPKYTPDVYQKYVPLFDAGLRHVQNRFDRLIQLFPDVLPHSFRADLVRAVRQLDTERVAYLSLPSWFDGVIHQDQLASFFCVRFAEVVRVLRAVARDADRRREAVTARPDAA
jgi:hypothetical protein